MKKGLFQSVIWLAFILITTQSRAQSVVQPLLHAFEQLDKDTCLKKADISFCLLDINTGKVIVEKNKDKLLAPASTLKTFTTATALYVLGENYQYQTRVTFKGKIQDKVGKGTLIIYGAGDPSLGSDRYDDTKPDKVFQQIVKALKSKGIEQLEGNIIVNKSIYTDENINKDWLDEDVGNYYGAGIYPLNWKENKFEINLIPTTNSFEVLNNTGTPSGLVNFITTLGGSININGYFYRNRIIVGDPNGQTGTPANVSRLGIGIPSVPHVPFQTSMFQAYGGLVTTIPLNLDSKSAVSSMIEKQGVGISIGNLSVAGFPSNTFNANYGVQGEFAFSTQTPTNPGFLNTAGGFFRNSLTNGSQLVLSQINAGVLGQIVNQAGNPLSALNAAVLGMDETRGSTFGQDITGDFNPDILETINNFGIGVFGTQNNVGRNYAGAFLGRVYASNRVGIGPSKNILQPVNVNAVPSNPGNA